MARRALLATATVGLLLTTALTSMAFENPPALAGDAAIHRSMDLRAARLAPRTTVDPLTPNLAPAEANARGRLIAEKSLEARLASPATSFEPSTIRTASLQAASAVSPVVGPAFDGLHYGTNDGFSNPWYPPDVQVAVGPSHVVEMVNALVGIWTKQGVHLSTAELSTFFGTSASDYISDPKIQFDAASSRWFASITDITTSSVRLAVSTSWDPTGSWYTSSVVGTGCLDQPLLGVGTATVIVSVNVFDSCTVRNPSYLGARYWVLNKSQLVTGSPAASASFGPFSNLASVHPAQILGFSENHFLVTVDWTSGSSANSILLFLVSGVPPGPVTVAQTSLGIRPVTVPPPADQPGTRHMLDTSDIRVSDAVWYEGKLWFGLDTGCTPSGDSNVRACVRLAEIDTASAAILQDFDVSAAGKDFFYPALRTDGMGNLVIVFGYSSATEFPGVMITGRLTRDAPNTIQPPFLVKAGSGPEDPATCSSTCRYGDYFGAGLDPSDPTLVWGAAEFGTSSGWSTHIFSARVKAILTLSYSVHGTATGYSPPSAKIVVNGTPQAFILDTTPTTYPADPGSTWFVDSTLWAPLYAQGRFEVNESSGAPATAGYANVSFTTVFEYFQQDAITFRYAISGGGSPPAPDIAFVQFAMPARTSAGETIWADHGSAYAYRNPLAGSTALERWFSMDTPSGEVSAPGNISLRYYHQHAVAFDYEVSGAAPSYALPSVTYASFGSLDVLTLPTSAWVDAGGAYAYSYALPGATQTERWASGPGASGTIHAPANITVLYRQQLYLSLVAAPEAAGALLVGAGWYDAGSSARISVTTYAGWRFQGWTGSAAGAYTGSETDVAITMNEPITETAVFDPGLTIASGSAGSVSYAYGTVSGAVPGGGSRTIYVPVGTIVTVTAVPASIADAFNGWTGAANGSSSTTTVRVDGPVTLVASFGPNIVFVGGTSLAAVAMVAGLALLAWTRRRKNPPSAP